MTQEINDIGNFNSVEMLKIDADLILKITSIFTYSNSQQNFSNQFQSDDINHSGRNSLNDI